MSWNRAKVADCASSQLPSFAIRNLIFQMLCQRVTIWVISLMSFEVFSHQASKYFRIDELEQSDSRRMRQFATCVVCHSNRATVAECAVLLSLVIRNLIFLKIKFMSKGNCLSYLSHVFWSVLSSGMFSHQWVGTERQSLNAPVRNFCRLSFAISIIWILNLDFEPGTECWIFKLQRQFSVHRRFSCFKYCVKRSWIFRNIWWCAYFESPRNLWAPGNLWA
jgi:hypothetical protein